jgi:hypothetical protein
MAHYRNSLLKFAALFFIKAGASNDCEYGDS